jgi:hypothetical protein
VAQLDWANIAEVLAADPAAAAAVSHVVAVSEYDLELGATVRDRLGVKGYSTEYVRRFRDKVYSKSLVAAAGVRTPQWMPVRPGMSGRTIDSSWSYPIVLKPVSGAASSGVTVCRGAAELDDTLRGLDPALDWEAETFVADQVYYCDGYAEDGVIGYLSLSKYVGTCTAFNAGAPLGAVSIQHTREAAVLREGAARTLRALGLDNGVFHLEAFLDGDEFVFLEIGHRPGGGEILAITHQHGGVDLMSVAVRLSCGLPPLYPGAEPRSPAGSYGWVMCSAVGQSGKAVKRISADGVLPPGVTIAHSLFPGQVIPDEPEYDVTGLSAHLYAASPEEAEAAMQRLLEIVVIEYGDPDELEA